MSDVTRLLLQIDSGDPSAADKLLPLIYEELRKLAAAKLAQEKPGQTLEATALVHEAYLRLVAGAETPNGAHESPKWNGRRHFFGAAAEAMRRILVERSRRKDRVRHGGDRQRVELSEIPVRTPDAGTILAVDEAIDRLAQDDPQTAEIVKLHFFAGLTLDETADALQISRANVYRQWAYARAALRLLLREDPGQDSTDS